MTFFSFYALDCFDTTIILGYKFFLIGVWRSVYWSYYQFGIQTNEQVKQTVTETKHTVTGHNMGKQDTSNISNIEQKQIWLAWMGNTQPAINASRSTLYRSWHKTKTDLVKVNL